MTTDDTENLIQLLIDRLAHTEQFLAARLGPNPAPVADQLDTTLRTARRLLLCTNPRPQRWEADIAAIAAYLDLSPTRLAALLTPSHPTCTRN